VSYAYDMPEDIKLAALHREVLGLKESHANVPRYVYSYLELNRVRYLSKDVKKATSLYGKVLPKDILRPKLTGVWTTRYSPNITNRHFKKKWYEEHGSMRGLPRPTLRVYTIRPGPGPLVKLEKKRRQQVSGWATAQEHKRVQRGKMPLGAIGPLAPYRAPGVAIYVPPFRRTGKTELARSKAATKAAADRVRQKYPDIRPTYVGRMTIDDKRVYASYFGGKTITVPLAPHHKKYWYFKRKRGVAHFSTHHPYGDELDLYRVFRKGET